jgi:hypothetical protein
MYGSKAKYHRAAMSWSKVVGLNSSHGTSSPLLYCFGYIFLEHGEKPAELGCY